MKRDSNTLVNMVFILEHIPAANKSRSAASVDCVGDFHASLAREKALQVHVEPGDTDCGR